MLQTPTGTLTIHPDGRYTSEVPTEMAMGLLKMRTVPYGGPLIDKNYRHGQGAMRRCWAALRPLS